MCECYAKLSKNDPRYEIWKQVTPDAKIPLKHPAYVRHPAYKDPLKDQMFAGLFLEGDPSRLTDEQKDKIVELMSKKFKVPKSHVREGLDKNILLIKSDNTLVSICEQHFRCMI